MPVKIGKIPIHPLTVDWAFHILKFEMKAAQLRDEAVTEECLMTIEAARELYACETAAKEMRQVRLNYSN